MADNGGDATRLPIKLVLPKQGAERKVSGGGGKPKAFREVDDEYRGRLSREVQAIGRSLAPQFESTRAIPVRVRLLIRAVAKSHRPEHLFSAATCPIVGAGSLGELFVKATPAGLSRLTSAIEGEEGDQLVKELSCIEAVEPVTSSYRRHGLESQEILRRSPRSAGGFMTRVRLFNFGPQDEDQQGLVRAFRDTVERREMKISQLGYSAASYTYGVECRSHEDVDALAAVVGVRNIAAMPLIRIIRPMVASPTALPDLTSRSDYSGDVPTVVVVDSGIEPLPGLESWVVGRESTVAPCYRNTDHGTFVAGLICWGGVLNPGLAGIDRNPCAVFDLQVMPNDRPEKGDVGALYEQEFLASLDDALGRHSNEYKVWNLSLGTAVPCSLDEFSALAEELDNLQEKYQVSFVISAGNYETPPLLDYPRSESQKEEGRITVPADSVLAITVGSVSNAGFAGAAPALHCPSAFSRHGAGPNHVIKPDLVHYGGAVAVDLSQVAGVRSVCPEGALTDGVGTSYSTPLVSRILAQIYHQVTPTPSPVLARALLTHHARDPRSGARVPDGEEDFFGFGLPAPVPYCLECTPHCSTLVFEDALRPGYFLEWDDFPYPPSLMRGGRYFGEVTMTVAFEPARGSRWGSEYCETHVEAHFGVWRDRVSRSTGEITTHFKGLVPPEHKNPGLLYESYQVEKLRKWAPVRTYRGDLGENGERGSRWRLKVQLTARHTNGAEEARRPQPFSLIVTIADPNNSARVYDEMARILQSRFQSQNLAVRATARIRGVA